MEKCEKISAREVKVSLRGRAVFVWTRICVHGAPARMRLELLKPSLCVPEMCVLMYVQVLLCVRLQEEGKNDKDKMW